MMFDDDDVYENAPDFDPPEVDEPVELRQAFVIHRGDRVELVLPYDKDFIVELKRFPARWRRYNPLARTWTVREPYVEDVVTLANRRYRLEFLAPVDGLQPRRWVNHAQKDEP